MKKQKWRKIVTGSNLLTKCEITRFLTKSFEKKINISYKSYQRKLRYS